jgi:hypothetical protein
MRAFRTPLGVASTVLAAYVVWAAWFATYHSLVDLARVGSEFQGRAAGESAAIDALADDAVDGPGYDGQFYLYVALDPGGAESYIDEPPYRYSRIAYPLAARVIGLGRADLIPFGLLLVNLLAVGAGTLAIAVLLRGRGLSPWYAALYGFFPGLFVAVFRDLAEPLAYALAAGGLLALERRRIPVAVALFALAGMTRETTLLFPLGLAAWLALGPRRFRDASLLAASVVPYLALRAGLWAWLGSPGDAQAQELELLPFGGLMGQWPWGRTVLEQLYSVVVPALLALAIAAAARARRPALVALAANVLVLVVLLPEPSYADYDASGRIATGVILGFLLCLPAVAAAGRLTQAWIAVVLWFAPWYALLPTAFER